MTHWIHFIGRSYYSEAKFVGEAATYGITRRVARRTLKAMNYGDVVWLAIGDGKSSIMFAKFTIDTLSGMSGDEIELLAARFGLKIVDEGGINVQRGCGSYVQGATFTLERPASLAEVLDAIEPAATKGKLMVGGQLIEVERVRLASMKFCQGFRPFDYVSYLADVSDADKPAKGIKRLKGFYYGKPGNETNVVSLDERRAQAVGNYRRKEEE